MPDSAREALAPQADFAQPDLTTLKGDVPAIAARWRKKHPASVWALMEEARHLISTGNHAGAKPLLERALELHPEQRAPDNAYLLLALVYRKLGQAADERRTLERLASLAADSVPAYSRLIEIAEAAKDLPALARNAERLLGVNPMAEAGWRALGRALEPQGGKDPASAERATQRAVAAYEKLLLLEPADQVETRYRLAKLLRGRNVKRAKHHLLEALAEAPRFREGYRLLLELRSPAARREPRDPRRPPKPGPAWCCWPEAWPSRSPTTRYRPTAKACRCGTSDKENPDDVFTFVRIKYPSLAAGAGAAAGRPTTPTAT